MKSQSSCSAPAKIILFGEHFVVYGNPAILAAVDRRITVTAKKTGSSIRIKSEIAEGEFSGDSFSGSKESEQILRPLYVSVQSVLSEKTGIEFDIKSDIPHGIGLGSSAASCVAIVAATCMLYARPEKQFVCDKAIDAERLIHKNSSGADCYISTFGGLMYYSKSEGFSRIKSDSEIHIVIADTGIKHSTGDLVQSVSRLKQKDEAGFAGLMDEARNICSKARSAIESANVSELGKLMNENQKLLARIGVSHKIADRLIDVSLKNGALGAKITGAGGGGAVIALASDRRASSEIAVAIQKSGYSAFEAAIDRNGLVL
ncbi:MAG: mevalonate kinase [Nitrososphaera sp.]|nr:mevalonate kinase [Nitrososphaera sp.]